MQIAALCVGLVGVGLFWKWTKKWDRETGATRDGIAQECWQQGERTLQQKMPDPYRKAWLKVVGVKDWMEQRVKRAA